MIVEYIIHSDIPNYTILAFNSLKMIQNDSFSANQTGDDWPLSFVNVVNTNWQFI